MPRAPELSRPGIRVAAGILRDASGRVLIADRRRAGTMQDYWEFPGGKIRSDESAVQALCRELGEELGISVTSCELFRRIGHDYPQLHVDIDFFLVTAWRGTPRGTEGQALSWVRIAELSPDTLLPADAPVVELLKKRNRG